MARQAAERREPMVATTVELLHEEDARLRSYCRAQQVSLRSVVRAAVLAHLDTLEQAERLSA